MVIEGNQKLCHENERVSVSVLKDTRGLVVLKALCLGYLIRIVTSLLLFLKCFKCINEKCNQVANMNKIAVSSF
jgi:hypothetical protein